MCDCGHGIYFALQNIYVPHPKSVVELFKYLIDDINTEFLHDENKKTQTKILNNYFKETTRHAINTITFAQNCIIIVKKTKEEEEIYNNRIYRYKKN